MAPPLILISPSTTKTGLEFADNSVNVSNQYGMAVAAAGGLPWIAPCLPARSLVQAMVARCDGVMLTGGDDLQPELYTRHLAPELRATVSGTDAERDLFELMLVDETFAQHKPLLAICRGHQLLNVAFGGTLFVDIPSQLNGALEHKQMERKNEVVHDASLTTGSLIANIVGRTQLGVNSSHHQAIKELAEPFRATARSSDGVIEAMELAPGAAKTLPFCLSVQFHPERLHGQHPEHLALFQTFVRSCMQATNV